MNQEQIDAIPTPLIYERDTAKLREWLYIHGFRLSLLELSNERKRRNDTSRSAPQRANRKYVR